MKRRQDWIKIDYIVLRENMVINDAGVYPWSSAVCTVLVAVENFSKSCEYFFASTVQRNVRTCLFNGMHAIVFVYVYVSMCVHDIMRCSVLVNEMETEMR